jgi:hypothetical protein
MSEALQTSPSTDDPVSNVLKWVLLVVGPLYPTVARRLKFPQALPRQQPAE